MWTFFKKRQPDDLRRLISAYRCYLRAAQQTEGQHRLDDEEKQERKWKGGFGKAFNQLFLQWPTPNESRRFEKIMRRRLNKGGPVDQAFIFAMNEYLGQKHLAPPELDEVLHQGRTDHDRSS